MRPYVGVTGFMTRTEVKAVAAALPRHPHRLLMVGVLASRKTIEGLPNAWPNRYPQRHYLGSIFYRHPHVRNIVHFSTSHSCNLFEWLSLALTFARPYVHGLQLNLCWPDPHAIEKLRKEYPGVQIILQIGERAFASVDHSPMRMAERIARTYFRLIDGVLLDCSGSTGKALDVEALRPFVDEIVCLDEGIGYGIAGGLDASNVGKLADLVRNYPDLSIDAEARLRTPNDNLDIEVAQQYVQSAYQALEGIS